MNKANRELHKSTRTAAMQKKPWFLYLHQLITVAEDAEACLRPPSSGIWKSSATCINQLEG